MSSRTRYEDYYGVSMLDDMHNFFPDLLYNNGRFRSIESVFAYINSQMNENFNLYSMARSRLGRNVRPRVAQQTQAPAERTTTERTPVEQTPAPRNSYFDDMMHIGIGSQRVAQPATPPMTQPRRATTVPSMLFPGLEVISSEYIIPPVTGTGGATAALASIASLLTGGDMTSRNLMDAFAGIPGFSEPVPVRPTRHQITAATTEEIVAEGEESLETCPICQDEIAIGTTMRIINHCDHSFHKECIDVWFSQNVHCPVCRHDIRELDEESETEGEERVMENVD
jgi:hypothetical protein